MDKELRELVKQDVDRTMQDCEFFTSEDVKDELSNVLYLWGKDNVEFGYRQGMNEVLAILVIAFFSEIVPSSEPELSKDKDDMKILTEEEIIALDDDQMVELLFNQKHTYADIYWCFDRLLGLGIKYLYQVTKDMATLKKEICIEMGIDTDPPANTQKAANYEQDQLVRQKLEKAYEDEKSKSVISQKCSRIYHDLLKK